MPHRASLLSLLFQCVHEYVFVYDSRGGDAIKACHTYAAPGVYTVSITGSMAGFGFGEPSRWITCFEHVDCRKLLDILQWGCARLGPIVISIGARISVG